MIGPDDYLGHPVDLIREVRSKKNVFIFLFLKIFAKKE